MARTGRPTVLTDEVIAGFFKEMTAGLTLKQVVEKHNFDYAHVSLKISKSEDLTRLHARAREEFAHVCVEKMFQIADDEPDVQRARLKCDNVKWYAARVLPKNYGDKMQLSGDSNAPLIIKTITETKFDDEK